jgi:hypothetical protein
MFLCGRFHLSSRRLAAIIVALAWAFFGILIADPAAACGPESAAVSRGPACGGALPPARNGWQTYTQASSPYRFQRRSERAKQEAKRFAGRIKRRLEKRYAGRRQQFRRHQAAMERQRRANKRSKTRNKARQFAAARRRATRHMRKRGHKVPLHASRVNRMPKPAVQGLTAGPPRWRALWRRRAQNDAK